MFNMVDLIEKKKRGQALSRQELDFFALGAARRTIPDYQLAALLMAIWFRGMTAEETRDLTLAMVRRARWRTCRRRAGCVWISTPPVAWAIRRRLSWGRCAPPAG